MSWEEIADSLENGITPTDITKKSIEVEGDKVENRGADDLIKLNQFARTRAEMSDPNSPYKTGRIVTSNGGDGLI